MRERLFENPLVRGCVAAFMCLRGAWYLVLGRTYRGIADYCWLGRVPGMEPFRTLGLRMVKRMVAEPLSGGRVIADAFLRDEASARVKARYSLGGKGDLVLERDMLVLKRWSADEKGVIILKYTETFDAFMAYFDVEAVADHYYLVLEPSWAGYCDPSILMYALPRRPVVVQCFTEEDYNFVRSLGTNLEPIRLGPADWIDPYGFPDPPHGDRKYDLIMIANWGRHKQHRRLFKALRCIDRPLHVLLIGFPWAGRTKEDIEGEARAVRSPVEIEIEESIPHGEVLRRLTQSKALIFLSKKEGDNKAVVEGFFADVPAIVYEDSIGGAGSRINPETGVLSSYRDLHRAIIDVVCRHREFSPRKWALANTGSGIATAKLDASLRRLAARLGEPYTDGIVEKSNSPNLSYRAGVSRGGFEDDYRLLDTLRRGSRVAVGGVDD